MGKYIHNTLKKKEVSYDGGLTWEDAYPYEEKWFSASTLYDSLLECTSYGGDFKAIFFKGDKIWFYPCDDDTLLYDIPGERSYDLVVVGKCVTEIPDGAFYDVCGGVNINMLFHPEGNLQRIGRDAFYNDSFKFGTDYLENFCFGQFNYTFPDSLQWIDASAFYCGRIGDVGETITITFGTGLNQLGTQGYGGQLFTNRTMGAAYFKFKSETPPAVYIGRWGNAGVLGYDVPCGSERAYYDTFNTDPNGNPFQHELFFTTNDLYEKCGSFTAKYIKADGTFEIEPTHYGSSVTGLTSASTTSFDKLEIGNTSWVSAVNISNYSFKEFTPTSQITSMELACNIDKLVLPRTVSSVTLNAGYYTYIDASDMVGDFTVSWWSSGHTITVGERVNFSFIDSSGEQHFDNIVWLRNDGVGIYWAITNKVKKVYAYQSVIDATPQYTYNPEYIPITDSSTDTYIASNTEYIKEGDKYYNKMEETVTFSNGNSYTTGIYNKGSELTQILRRGDIDDYMVVDGAKYYKDYIYLRMSDGSILETGDYVRGDYIGQLES